MVTVSHSHVASWSQRVQAGDTNGAKGWDFLWEGLTVTTCYHSFLWMSKIMNLVIHFSISHMKIVSTGSCQRLVFSIGATAFYEKVGQRSGAKKRELRFWNRRAGRWRWMEDMFILFVVLEHFLFFHSVGNVIIPTGFHIFQRGRLNQQPVIVCGRESVHISWFASWFMRIHKNPGHWTMKKIAGKWASTNWLCS